MSIFAKPTHLLLNDDINLAGYVLDFRTSVMIVGQAMTEQKALCLIPENLMGDKEQCRKWCHTLTHYVVNLHKRSTARNYKLKNKMFIPDGKD